jgi:hypothetical protein
MQNNLPKQTRSKSKPSWNTEDFCRYCDLDTLKDIAKDNVSDPDDEYEYDKVFNEIYISTGICRHCKEEETADFRDDD